jgi:hypothetical protein
VIGGCEGKEEDTTDMWKNVFDLLVEPSHNYRRGLIGMVDVAEIKVVQTLARWTAIKSRMGEIGLDGAGDREEGRASTREL